jgi:hypothetical protein
LTATRRDATTFFGSFDHTHSPNDMTIDWLSCFANAYLYDDFLEKYGTKVHIDRWHENARRIELPAERAAVFGGFVRRMKVLCLAGTWCGDCALQCPIFRKLEQAVNGGLLEVRFLDRDDAPEDVLTALRINGGNRVPAVVFLSEDGYEAARYGEKTLAQYRRETESLQGMSCSLGIATPDDSAYRSAVVSEWADQFERAQLILRLSARLRTKYGD